MAKVKSNVVIPERLAKKAKELGLLTRIRRAIKISWAKRTKENSSFVESLANTDYRLSSFINNMCPWEFTVEGKHVWHAIKNKVEDFEHSEADLKDTKRLIKAVFTVNEK